MRSKRKLQHPLSRKLHQPLLLLLILKMAISCTRINLHSYLRSVKRQLRLVKLAKLGKTVTNASLIKKARDRARFRSTLWGSKWNPLVLTISRNQSNQPRALVSKHLLLISLSLKAYNLMNLITTKLKTNLYSSKNPNKLLRNQASIIKKRTQKHITRILRDS